MALSTITRDVVRSDEPLAVSGTPNSRGPPPLPEPKKYYAGQAEYYYPAREVPSATTGHRVFLGGTIEQGDSPDWQRDAIQALSHLPATIFNPRRPHWDASWEPRARHHHFNAQVVWELGLLESAEVIAFYLHPGTKSPISLLEIGMFAPGNRLAPRPGAAPADPGDAARDLPDYDKDPVRRQPPPAGGRQHMVVCCPEGFERRGNVEVVAHRYGITLVETFPELVDRVVKLLAGPDATPNPAFKVPSIEKWRKDPAGGWLDETGAHVEDKDPLVVYPTEHPTDRVRLAHKSDIPLDEDEKVPAVKRVDRTT